MTEHVGEEPGPRTPRVTDPREPGFSCLNCGGESFTNREVLLNTSGMSFMNLDVATKSVHGLICVDCGFVHVFAFGVREPSSQKYFGQP